MATRQKSREVETAARSDEWNTKRRHIHHVAAEVFADMGFERGTTREIARRVGLTQPALYYYVGSKEDLLSQIAVEVADEFTARITEALSSTDEPVPRLRAVIAAFVQAMSEYHKEFGLRFSELRSVPQPIFDELRDGERRFVSLIADAVKDAQAAGALPVDRDHRVLTLGIMGMLSWTFTWLSPEHHDVDDVIATFCDLIGLPSEAAAGRKRRVRGGRRAV